MTSSVSARTPVPVPAGDADGVPVWDLFVRLFHWSLVASVVALFATGDDAPRLHAWLGYGVAGLIGARLVWGVVGPARARFASFVRGPRETIAYLVAALRFRAPRHLGHNPAGGAMIVALLALLSFVTTTGILLETDAWWGDERLEHIHKAAAWGLVGLVALHVAGVLAASLAHRENLVRAMLTGRKRAGP